MNRNQSMWPIERIEARARKHHTMLVLTDIMHGIAIGGALVVAFWWLTGCAADTSPEADPDAGSVAASAGAPSERYACSCDTDGSAFEPTYCSNPGMAEAITAEANTQCRNRIDPLTGQVSGSCSCSCSETGQECTCGPLGVGCQ